MNRILLATLVFTILLGCAAAPYQSPTAGSRAEIVFSAPNLESEFLADTDLTLFVSNANDQCEPINGGTIELTPSARSLTFQVPAGERIYLIASYWATGLFHTSRGDVKASFVPEENKNYSLQFMKVNELLELNFFEKMADGTLEKRALQPRNVCKVKNGNQ